MNSPPRVSTQPEVQTVPKLHIAYLISHFPPVVGGAETQAALLTTAFADRGHEITVITRRVPGTRRQEARRGVRIIRVDVGPPTRWAAFRYVLRGYRVLREFAPFDVIQTSQL